MIAAKPTRILLLATVLIQGSFVLAADEPGTSQNTEISNLQSSIIQQQQIAAYREQVAEMGSEFGPYDQRLLESLQGLTDALIEAGDYAEAGSVIGRRLQLLRRIDGPENPNQLPVIAELINNHIRQQDWRSVTEQFETVYWLRSQDENTDTATLGENKKPL